MRRWIVPCALALFGCGGTQERRADVLDCIFELTDVVREETKEEFGVRFTLQFRVRNPNAFPVRVEGLTAQAEARGIPLGLVYLPAPLSVPPGKGDIMRIPLVVNTHQVPGSLAAVQDPKSVFRFVGKARIAELDAAWATHVRDRWEQPLSIEGCPE